MELTTKTITDKIETVAILDHYILQVRERKVILEDGVEISSAYHRYSVLPDNDLSTITDETVKAQFNAIMTDEIKQAYIDFNAEQAEQKPKE